MPIYEYQALESKKSCAKCRNAFELLQDINDEPVSTCDHCGSKVKKIISWCRSAIIENSEDHLKASKKIKEYEKNSMWSHAAELADKHSEKLNDNKLKERALENYKKAGYDI